MSKRKFTNEAEWKEDRSRSIGASESAALFGLGYVEQTELKIWGEKTGRLEGFNDPNPFNRMRIGQALEEPILDFIAEWVDLYSRQEDWPLDSCTDIELIYNGRNVYYYDHAPFISATPDGIISLFNDGRRVAQGVAEAKNIGRDIQAWREGRIPLSYQIQVQQQMLCTGFDFGVIGALLNGGEFVAHIIYRDEPFMDQLVEKCSAFWSHVLNDTEPPISEKAIDKSVITKLHPDDNGQRIEMNEEQIEQCFVLSELREKMSQTKGEIDAIENSLRQVLGDHTYLDSDEFEVALKTQERKEVLQKASKFRRLYIKPKKGKNDG